MVDRQGSQFTAYSIDLQLRSEGLCSGEELLEGVIDHDGLEEVWEEAGAGDLGACIVCGRWECAVEVVKDMYAEEVGICMFDNGTKSATVRIR